MEIYEQAMNLLLNHPQSLAWPELAKVCERARSHRPIAWDFSIVASEAVGGQPEAATAAVAALTCAHMALILIDDLLDEDPRGLHNTIGMGRAANLSTGLIAMGMDILHKSEIKQRQLAAAALGELVLNTAYGQDLDVQNVQTEEAYWEVTRAKSSPYFGTGLYLGALCAGASLELAEKLKEFGRLFGEIMQIHDDLNDCLATPANVDWMQGRSPLPILFASIVAHPQQERFIELRGKAADSAALEEAQAILVSSGAISYCVNELMLRQGQAKSLLVAMSLPNPQPLAQLLEQAIAPVQNLFAKVGAEFPVIS